MGVCIFSRRSWSKKWDRALWKLHWPDSWCRSILSTKGAQQCCNGQTLPLGGDTWTLQHPESSRQSNYSQSSLTDFRTHNLTSLIKLKYIDSKDTSKSLTSSNTFKFYFIHNCGRLSESNWLQRQHAGLPCAWHRLQLLTGTEPSPCDCSHRPPSVVSCDPRHTCPSLHPPEKVKFSSLTHDTKL